MLVKQRGCVPVAPSLERFCLHRDRHEEGASQIRERSPWACVTGAPPGNHLWETPVILKTAKK